MADDDARGEQTDRLGEGVRPLVDVLPPRPADRSWTDEAVRRLQADANRSADTHLVRLDLPAGWDVDVYLKDESTHPTGSLKHRLARSLFLYALCNGWIGPDSTVVEASSGSTAVSEAYFAQLLGLRFVAVMTQGTSRSKIELIERYGGLAGLRAAVDGGDPELKGARRARLEAAAGYLDLAPRVVGVVRDLPVPPDLDTALPTAPADPDALAVLTERYALASPVRRLGTALGWFD